MIGFARSSEDTHSNFCILHMKTLEQHQLIHLTSFTILLLVALKISTVVFYNSSTIWIAGYSFLALLLARYKFAIAELPLLKLLQLLGGGYLLSFLFSTTH